MRARSVSVRSSFVLLLLMGVLVELRDQRFFFKKGPLKNVFLFRKSISNLGALLAFLFHKLYFRFILPEEGKKKFHFKGS
jgi:energy-coupling factor transporter transmembrane protein EcfT